MAKTKTRIVLPYNLTCSIKDICPSAEFLGINHLHDYALCYRDGMLTAETKKGHIVDTPVYMIDADEEKHLDKKIRSKRYCLSPYRCCKKANAILCMQYQK